MLVAALVLSVAIAGISELLWVNTSWTSRIFNKAGAYFYAQKFLNILRNDVDSAFSIDSSSTSDSLVLNKVGFDENNFPTGIERITYSVIPELESGSPTGKYQIQRMVVSKGTTIVAKGVSGPTSNTNNLKIQIFQYVPKRPDASDSYFGIRDSAIEGAGSVIVNLQILNRDMGKNVSTETSSNATSDIGIRAELFTRNETSAI
jgi:hypothetical protein